MANMRRKMDYISRLKRFGRSMEDLERPYMYIYGAASRLKLDGVSFPLIYHVLALWIGRG